MFYSFLCLMGGQCASSVAEGAKGAERPQLLSSSGASSGGLPGVFTLGACKGILRVRGGSGLAPFEQLLSSLSPYSLIFLSSQTGLGHFLRQILTSLCHPVI